jgi:predicted nucleotidyltransferase
MGTTATEATEGKRAQLLDFIERKLEPHAAVRGVVGVGSIATGTARPGSDIDAVVFMSPFDPYLVPAESVWRARDDTFHTIFSDDPTLDEEGIQLDLHRVDLGVWSSADFEWPEPSRAELATGWLAFDRDGEVARLVEQRTTYPDDLRLRILDDAIPLISDHLGDDVVARAWETLGPVVAGDRLQAVYEYLAKALFAYNRRWRGWRNREMSALLRLPWLPERFDQRILAAAVAAGHDRAAYLGRAETLRQLSDELIGQLVDDGIYGADTPVDEAFIRAHDEPGRAWNMDHWNAEHARREAL